MHLETVAASLMGVIFMIISMSPLMLRETVSSLGMEKGRI
jgi:hypothetical protein